MTDAIMKLSDMQQRSIEYERQRHLANWLIESSPHMPKTVQCQQQQQQKKHKKIFTTSIFHDSFLFLSKFGPSTTTNLHHQSTEQDQIIQSPAPIISPHTVQQHTNLTKSSSAFTSSQTNLPLQIVQSSRDGNKPKLRRFNSHDTSANMFSVADFENARLARRNELELVRQKQRYKMNSLSSGCDSSTGDSKGSKLSNESKIINNDPMSAEMFLDRYSLPRVARLIVPQSKGIYDEKLNQSSNSMAVKSKKSVNHGNSSYPINSNQQQMNTNSHESGNGANYQQQHDDIKANATVLADNNNNGELFLLYRHLKKYKVYHAINAKSGTNRKKGIKIPQDFTGYFSLVNDKGMPTATLYTTMIQLVRERVYKFLSVDNMQAYTESNPSDNTSSKSHYIKTTAKAGEVFRLLAVFEDGGQSNGSYSSTKKDNLNSIGREKEKGRYVQLMSESRQIIYVALSTKGKFYEIEHSSSTQQQQQMFTKSSSGKGKQLNADCVHRISSIITDETIFPLNLKFISKHVNGLTHASIPENIKITKVSIENSVIACPIDETEFCNPLHLVKLYLHPDMKFMKSTLGFENDKVMFSNQNVQNLLKFCQFNCDNFARAIEYETLPKENIMKSNDNLAMSTNKVKSKTSAFSKFFSSDKNSPAHEREDSIIFLSKNDLENLEQQKQLNQENQEKKAFQPSNNKKGWFKNLRNSSSNSNTNPSSSKTSSFINLNSNSMDRYQDMSKLIQERFGTIEINENPSTTLKSSSEISYDLNERTNKAMQKCFSLQNIELNSSMDIQAPDLVAKHKKRNSMQNDDNKIEKDLTYNGNIHSSNDSALNSNSNPRQQSFITEKLFNEFYVKTKQYSKSSSSLHQLLHFSVPQKMNIRETRKRLEKVDDNDDDKHSINRKDDQTKSALMQLQLPPPPSTEPSSENENNESTHDDDASIITDDLPYCSVRDSIVQAQIIEAPRETPTESIYAEICASTPPVPSSNGSELSYNVEKPIRAVKNHNNISSIRISFGQDIHTGDSAVKYN